MAQNLELKARCRSLGEAVRTIRSLGARDGGVLHQVDTYFTVPFGRMKLRHVRGGQTELIFYDRPSTAGQKGRWSSYLVYPVMQPGRLMASLSKSWPIRVVVRKRRRLALLQNARIHLDEVEGLGSFVEFEVLLTGRRGQTQKLYHRLRSAFGIQRGDLIGGSYADLLRPLRCTG